MSPPPPGNPKAPRIHLWQGHSPRRSAGPKETKARQGWDRQGQDLECVYPRAAHKGLRAVGQRKMGSAGSAVRVMVSHGCVRLEPTALARPESPTATTPGAGGHPSLVCPLWLCGLLANASSQPGCCPRTFPRLAKDLMFPPTRAAALDRGGCSGGLLSPVAQQAA